MIKGGGQKSFYRTEPNKIGISLSLDQYLTYNIQWVVAYENFQGWGFLGAARGNFLVPLDWLLNYLKFRSYMG